MKAVSKRIWSFIFLLFTLGVVLYIGLNGTDIAELWRALHSLSPIFLALCVGCWLVHFIADAISIQYFLRKQDYRLSFWQSLYISLTGLYYCNVTPGATGGQPMQVYRLRQYNVPIGVSSSGMSVRFFCFQTTLLVIGAICWIIWFPYVNAQLGSKQWLVVLGYVINFFSIGMILVMAISKRAVHFLVTLCIRIGTKLHICKDPVRSMEKWDAHIASFHGSVQMIRRHPKELLVQCLIAAVQIVAQMGVIIMVYHAFGLSGASLPHLFTLGVLLYISASYVPLPGASGAQEGGFALYFQGIFPDAYLLIALLIWRFCTYYLPVLLGVIMTVVESVKGMRKSADALD